MDDVGRLSIEVLGYIAWRLPDFGVDPKYVSEEDKDRMYEFVFDWLEKYSSGDYRNYN